MKKLKGQIGDTQDNGFLKIVRVEKGGYCTIFHCVCIHDYNGAPCGMPRTVRATQFFANEPRACKRCVQSWRVQAVRVRAPRTFKVSVKYLPAITSAVIDRFIEALQQSAKINRRDLEKYACDLATNPSVIATSKTYFELRTSKKTKVLLYRGVNHAS